MNEWLVVLVSMIFFLLVAVVIMSISVGTWFGLHWLFGHVKSLVRREPTASA